MNTKTCNKCNETKALVYFEKDSRNKDGLQGICSNCRKLHKQKKRDERRAGKSIIFVENKTCNRCNKTKPSNQFYRDSGISDGRATICKTCRDEKTIEWRKSNSIKVKNRTDKYNARHYQKLRLQRYKITPEEHQKMLIEQNYCCKICGKKPNSKRPLYVDHHHKTGKVRGLLCAGCNRSIAVFDDPILLEKAQAYLLKTKTS